MAAAYKFGVVATSLLRGFCHSLSELALAQTARRGLHPRWPSFDGRIVYKVGFRRYALWDN